MYIAKRKVGVKIKDKRYNNIHVRNVSLITLANTFNGMRYAKVCTGTY